MEHPLLTPIRILSESSLKDQQIYTLNIINNITTGLSLLGIAYFFYLSHKLRNKSFILSLITNLMVSDLSYSLSNVLINFDDDPMVCKIEGFFREYSQLTTLFWALSLAFLAFKQTVHNITNLQNKYWIMKLIGFGFPLLISVIPLIPPTTLKYGKMGTYCWIVRHDETELPFWLSVVMLLGYIWIALVLVTYWYVRIYFFIRNLTSSAISMRQLFVYPLILLFSFFPTTVDRFLSNTSLVYISAIIHISTQHLNGFLNAITYGVQATRNIQKTNRVHEESIRNSIKSALNKVNYTNLESSHHNLEDYQDIDEIPESLTNSVRHELLKVSEHSDDYGC